MNLNDTTMEQFEEDSAILKGLQNRANDKGYETVGEAINAAPSIEEVRA